MFVFKEKKIKFFIIAILISVIHICKLYAGDLEIIATNYKLSSSRLTCEVLIKNTTHRSLYVITPNDIPYIITSEDDNYLTIKTFSQKNLDGDFSLNCDNIKLDNPNTDYNYAFYSEVKTNENLVLFFDIELLNSVCIDSEVNSLYNYDFITIQYLYSNTFIDNHFPLFINDFTIDCKVKEKISFNILDYIRNWDSSVIYIETKK